MSDIKISQLNSATTLGAADLIAISKSLGSGRWESLSITGEKLLNSLASTRLLKVAKDGTRDSDTISGAVALAVALSPSETNPVAIQVVPGSYYEDNPVVIPQWVSLYSEGGLYSSAIIANHDGIVLITSGNSNVDGFTIIGGTSFSNVAYKSSTHISSSIKNCLLINCHTGLLSDNGSISANTIVGLSFQRPIENFIKSINGGFITALGCSVNQVMTSPINGYYCSDSGSELYMWDCAADGCTNGINLNNSGYMDCFSGHFEDCTNAVHIGSSGSSRLRCVSTIIEDSLDKDLFVESPTATLSYVGAFDSSKFAIVNGATVSSQANDKNTGGGLSIGKTTSWNTMNIGTPGTVSLGKEMDVNIGEGGSFTKDQYGNPIVEFWSYNDGAPSGSKFTRYSNNAGTQLTGANDAIIVGCKYQFPAIRLNVNTVMGLVNPSDYVVAEYWNGLMWVGLTPINSPYGGGGVACYRASDYQPRNRHLFRHVETEYVECSHELYDNGDWSDDINVIDQIPLWDSGEPFYAIRFRNQQPLASGMVFSDGRVKPHSFVFSSSGKQINFGVYRTNRSLYIDSSGLANSIDYPVSFTDIQVSSHISYRNVPLLTKSNANLNNVTSMSLAFTLPYDIDTSSPLHVYIDGTTVSPATGNIVTTIYTSRIDANNPPLAFPLTEYETGPQVTAVPGLANGFSTVTQPLDISPYNAEDLLFISFARTPDDPDDTYSGDFIVGDVTLKYKGKFV